MYFVSELIGVIAEQCALHLFLQGIFSPKEKPWWHFILAYTVFGFVMAFFSFIPDASFLRLGMCAIGSVIISRVLFRTKLSQALYSSVSFCGLYVLTDVITIGIFSLAKIDTQVVMSHSIARTVCITISHMLFLVLIEIVLAITNRKRTAITLPFLLTLSPGYIAGIFLGLSYCQQVLSGNDSMSIAFLLSAIGLLYLNILIILYAERAKSASDQQLQLELAEHHYAMQEQYYDQLRCEQEETRAMFHDINKYMQAMRAVASRCSADEANHILEETQKLFDSIGTVVDVGNSVVSVILNEYTSNADEVDIPFHFDVSVPHNLGITAVDLYVLLGNTLDNAIEACCSLPEDQRYINLQLRTFHNILFYRIENPYAPDYPGKGKGKNHGYGLQNVRKCVEKHAGDMSISQEDGKFILSLRLNDCVPLDCELVHHVTGPSS